MNHSFTTRQLSRRQGAILGAFRTGAARPNSEIIRELAEIVEVLDDAPIRPNVIARLTVTRANGNRTIIQVHENATFHQFFHIYIQSGNRRSTKTHRRNANRNEGLVEGVWGLEGFALRLARYQSQSNPIVQSKIKIYRKRAYRRLLSVSPDQIWRTS